MIEERDVSGMSETGVSTAPGDAVLSNAETHLHVESSAPTGGGEGSDAAGTRGKRDMSGKQPALSTLGKSTVEIVLQVSPHQGTTETRKIRHMITVNGKTLRVGSLRVDTLLTLLSTLADQNPEQLLLRLAEYVAECQQRVNEVQQVLTQRPTATASGASKGAIGHTSVHPSLLTGTTTAPSSQHVSPSTSPLQPLPPLQGVQGQVGEIPASADTAVPAQQLSLFS